MTKRKRDLLTVMEAINSWFETSENPIAPNTDPAGSPNNIASEGPTANCVVPAPGSVGETVRWEELGHVSPGNAQLGTCSEVAGSYAIYPAGEPRVSRGTKAGTERGPADVGNPGSSSKGIQPIPQLGAEVKGEGEVSFATFWDVLRAAEYDVW